MRASTSCAVIRSRVPARRSEPPSTYCAPELLADLRAGHRLVAKRHHRRAREDAQLLHLRQLRDHVLGHAVAEVLVLLGAAQVLEVEDGHRLVARAGAGATRPESISRFRRFRSACSSVADW